MMHKVLTLRASSIGDALMGKYFLENVHVAFPEAECFMLVGSRGKMIRNLLLGYPWLTVVETHRRAPRSLLAAWRALRGCDIALTQYSERPFSTPSKLFARLVSKRLIGFEDAWWGNRFLYDVLVPWSGEAHSDGMIVEEQKALTAANIPISLSELTFSYIDNPVTLSATLSRRRLDRGKYTVVHLFSGNEGRSVSQKKRIEIVGALRHAISHTIVLTGAEADASQAAEVSRELSHVLNLAGKTSMQEFLNLVGSARSVVSLDTGAAHIAAHLKKPLVVLTRKEARAAWWGKAMYGSRPMVLCNELVDDEAPRGIPYPPSLETIDTRKIADIVAKL